ncbi:Ribonuclease BN, tRNA processing enzyme [Ruaniaceae bacterium KH17]|nr:Ribonuclease BN, tRNA processing enzyme [Ruaniaceae bacterium KH17]
MKLTILGCTGSMSGPDSAASSYLIQADGDGRTWSLVLDMGSGAFGSLFRYGDPEAIDAILLSHLHADHMSDMVSCHVHRRWNPKGPLGPVATYAPAGAVDRVRGVGGDPLEEDFSGEFTFHEFTDGGSFEVGPFTITSHAVVHPVPAYALRVEGPASGGGRAVITYSGDTDACVGLEAAARDADLFLCEAAFVEGRDTVRGIHLTGERAGDVATEAGASRLVLTHIQPWTDPAMVADAARTHFAGPVELAATGAVFEV